MRSRSLKRDTKGHTDVQHVEPSSEHAALRGILLFQSALVAISTIQLLLAVINLFCFFIRLKI